MELEFVAFDIIILLYSKSQKTEENEIFSQGTYSFQNLGNKTLVIADYQYVKISETYYRTMFPELCSMDS